VALSRGLSADDPEAKRCLLEELLKDILANPDYSVVVGDERVPLTVEYLTEREDWISNAAAVEIQGTISEQLGSRYSENDMTDLFKTGDEAYSQFLYYRPHQGGFFINELVH